MEVSRSPQDGGLQVAASGGLKVAAEWRSLGRRRSADHCGKEEVFVAIGWRYSNRRWVEVSIGWRSSGYRGVKVLCRQWVRSSGRRKMEIFRTPYGEGLQDATGWGSRGRHKTEVPRSPYGGDIQVIKGCKSSSRHKMEIAGIFHPTRNPGEGLGVLQTLQALVSELEEGCRESRFRLLKSLHEIKQPGEETKGAVTIFTEAADTSFSIIQCNLLC